MSIRESYDIYKVWAEVGRFNLRLLVPSAENNLWISFPPPILSRSLTVLGNVLFIQISGQHLKVDPVQAPQASCVAHQHTIRVVPHFQICGQGPRKVHRVEAKGLYFLVLGSQPNGLGRKMTKERTKIYKNR